MNPASRIDSVPGLLQVLLLAREFDVTLDKDQDPHPIEPSPGVQTKKRRFPPRSASDSW
jgi:hypothetical protein